MPLPAIERDHARIGRDTIKRGESARGDTLGGRLALEIGDEGAEITPAAGRQRRRRKDGGNGPCKKEDAQLSLEGLHRRTLK